MFEISESMKFIVGTLGGSLIIGIAALGISWQNKRSEERKHINSLILNTAVENWKTSINIAATQKRKIKVFPLDSYIVNIAKLSDLILNQRITKRNLPKKLKILREISDEYRNFLLEESEP